MSRTVKSSSELRKMPAYSLEYEENVPDCNGHGMVFRHIKSGARVCVISNNDENKVFSIYFRTTPTDDTGVPHIIEHSVLCGSEKFPPKDPFMELAKGSLNTFLNAFTFPDKTGYPVASCNDADFANLMDVYMDAVLHPNIYRHEEIFKQEGWHYELTSKDEPLTLNGVVYSEMKGAFSAPEDRQSRQIFSALFPDNTYGVESGGDPKHIPELTYAQFLDFHRRYYHPTNSYIFLYGNVDIEERMEWLDSAYLCNYDVQPVDSEVKYQKPIGNKEMHDYYAISEEDPEEDAAYLAWALTFGDYDDPLKTEAFNILCDVLFNNPGAPVKEALIKAGIGQDITCDIMTALRQPSMFLTARNTEASKLAELKRIVREELEKQVRDGINKQSLLAAVNGNEFRYCEADFGYTPKGLEYTIFAMTTWLYNDKMAFTQLHKRELFPVLRQKIDEGYFEELISKYMLNSESSVYHVLEPKRGLAAVEEKALADKLEAYKKSLSSEEIDALIAGTAALKAYQAEPSTPEELMTIPLLARSDIERKAPEDIIEKTEINGIKTYFHDIDTNGIVYFKMLYDLDKVAFEDVPYLVLGTMLVGNMDTSKHSYLELNNEVNIHTGGIATDVTCFSIRGGRDLYRPMLNVEGHVMDHSFEKMLELTDETLFDTDFSSFTRIKEILGEVKARMQYSMPAAGHRTGMRRASASVSSMARYNEAVSGIDAYRFVCAVLAQSDEEMAETVKKVKAVLKQVLGKDNVFVDITCNKDIFEKIKAAAGGFVEKLDDVRGGDTEGARFGQQFDLKPTSEAFKTAGEVNYLGLAGSCDEITPDVSGKLAVVQNILSSEYLWNNVRVLGGAYGAGFNFNAIAGYGFFYSYRDPHLAETHEIYKKSVDFLNDFDCDERTMTKFVIGTMGGMDTPLSPAAKGSRALGHEIGGTTYDMVQATRNAALDIDPAAVRSTAKVVKQMLEGSSICAVGCESTINKNKDMFEDIKNLL